MAKKTVLVIVLLIAVGLGYWLVSPVFLDNRVNDKLSEEGSVILAQGMFEDVAHHGSGTAKLVKLPNGEIMVRFEDFEILNGPDLRVLLSTNPSPRSAAELGAYIEIGKLKGNIGNQNYTLAFGENGLPPEADVSTYKSVVIYCNPFKVVFNYAGLDGAPSGATDQSASDTSVSDLVGGWAVLQGESTGWQSIILDEDGGYYTHLNERPFDTGTWIADGNMLLLASDAGSEMNHAFDISWEGMGLKLTEHGNVSIWRRVQ